jgi:hypothetical protein
VAFADACPIRLVEAEDFAHIFKVSQLPIMHGSVRLGDMKQAVQNILQLCRIVCKYTAHIAGVGVEACDIAFRQIVDAADIPLLAGRHGENLAERVHLRARDHAVGLRHLGAQRDHRDRKGGVPPGFRAPNGAQHVVQAANGRAERGGRI